ncbi:Sodium transporter HKT1 [Morella rubra]|uniref:Sodium transporter HKT1 n=1 Tax=Morella rubra TaxID=262757 RepID=A0A6A1W4L5_9ROSI|nr:Sodium transporter HKT1 [Morella rubra]
MPQIRMENTLYPPCHLLVIWVLNKITKQAEFDFMLRNYRDMGYGHLLSGTHAALLAATVFGFTLIQFILFFSMEWNSEAMEGLSLYQKLVGSLFQTVDSRHTGESVFDLSSNSVTVRRNDETRGPGVFSFRYLPPYTAFVPIKKAACEVSETGKGCGRHRRRITFNIECLMFSQLSYLTICIIVIYITQRHKIKDDSLNFNVLNITLEVISAYGSVGFSTGYNCKRQLKPERSCRDTWYGFAGRWSTQGKLILIFVMFFGRLKEFTMKSGKAWKLS